MSLLLTVRLDPESQEYLFTWDQTFLVLVYTGGIDTIGCILPRNALHGDLIGVYKVTVKWSGLGSKVVLQYLFQAACLVCPTANIGTVTTVYR